MEPHQHGYNISNMVIVPYASKFVPPSWFHHILGLILNPWDDTGQRRPSVPYHTSSESGFKHNGGADFESCAAVKSLLHGFLPHGDS